MSTAAPTIKPLNLVRSPERFVSDDKRVIARYFDFGNPDRIRSILRRVMRLPEEHVGRLLAQTIEGFHGRHHDLHAICLDHFANVARHINGDVSELSDERKLLIGAYFTMEYSIESAALFNPSVVVHPNQEGVPDGSVRFLMSMRATGEGHVSSIVFRRGVIDRHGQVKFDPTPRQAYTARPVPDRQFEKKLVFRKLIEMGVYEDAAAQWLFGLPDTFTLGQASRYVAECRANRDRPTTFDEMADHLLWVLRANYTLRFPNDTWPNQTVIFPATDHEARGMEDLRLVRFIGDDGNALYLGTYTAYDGRHIVPMMLETEDFHTYHVSTLNGRFARNKGMALFPRMIDGWYLAVSRHDGENMFLLKSDNRHFWNESVPLYQPREPWETVQVGNCGSPLETDAGWILLTHGVGTVRRYCIGALLLDRHDPSKIIGRLREPLIAPSEDEREGYVPNVVYSCGAMIHGDLMFIPYAASDKATTFATLPVRDLIDRMLDEGP